MTPLVVSHWHGRVACSVVNKGPHRCKIDFMRNSVNISQKSFRPRFYDKYFLGNERQILQLIDDCDIILLPKEWRVSQVRKSEAIFVCPKNLSPLYHDVLHEPPHDTYPGLVNNRAKFHTCAPINFGKIKTQTHIDRIVLCI